MARERGKTIRPGKDLIIITIKNFYRLSLYSTEVGTGIDARHPQEMSLHFGTGGYVVVPLVVIRGEAFALHAIAAHRTQIDLRDQTH